MKSYRNAIAALALVLAITTSVSAGIMHTEKATPTPTPTVNGIMVAEATNGVADTGGIIHSENAGSAPGGADAVTQVALNLLQSALTLF